MRKTTRSQNLVANQILWLLLSIPHALLCPTSLSAGCHGFTVNVKGQDGVTEAGLALPPEPPSGLHEIRVTRFGQRTAQDYGP